MSGPIEIDATEPPKRVRLGLLGCGNVGAALVGLIERDRDEIAARTGILLEVTRIAVRSLSKERGLSLPDGVLTTDGETWFTRRRMMQPIFHRQRIQAMGETMAAGVMPR